MRLKPEVVNNLYQAIPDKLPDELIETLVQGRGMRIERIVSRGHATPGKEWYDQDQNEWVVLLSGGARLEFDDGEERRLSPGDWVDIPAHRRHRVSWTDEATDTVWLAVFYSDG